MGSAFGKSTLGGGKSPSKTFIFDGDEALQVRVPVKAGLHQVMATMLKTDDASRRAPVRTVFRSSAGHPTIRTLADRDRRVVDRRSLWRRKCRPIRPAASFSSCAIPRAAADEIPCATKILSRLARRAYRRSADRRRRPDAAQLLQACPGGRKLRRRDSRRAGARAW